MLYFAYGANMHRAHMAARCPGAQAIARASLRHWRFIVTRDGYASLSPRPGAMAHGVLWSVTPRDLAVLHAYENVTGGLYRFGSLAVRSGTRSLRAAVYLARTRCVGRPWPGYLAVVLAAAQDWDFPQPYIRSIARFAPNAWRGAAAPDAGDVR